MCRGTVGSLRASVLPRVACPAVHIGPHSSTKSSTVRLSLLLTRLLALSLSPGHHFWVGFSTSRPCVCSFLRISHPALSASSCSWRFSGATGLQRAGQTPAPITPSARDHGDPGPLPTPRALSDALVSPLTSGAHTPPPWGGERPTPQPQPPRTQVVRLPAVPVLRVPHGLLKHLRGVGGLHEALHLLRGPCGTPRRNPQSPKSAETSCSVVAPGR